MAFCQFLALAKSKRCLVKLGNNNLFILANALNINYLFAAKV